MRVTQQTMDSHRAAILDAAGRLFRRRGIAHVSVADVTRAAGLTHGAFYGHYPSKAALAEASCRTSLDAAAATWRRRGARARAEGRCGVQAIVAAYLTERHRDAPEDGCAFASLGPEMTRADPTLHAALSDGVAALTAALADEIAFLRPDADAETRARAARAVLSAITGGLILARATTEPACSSAILASASALARHAADL